MSELASHFQFDLRKSTSNSKAILKGSKYRITILSDVLIRFEYSENGQFCDYPSFLAIDRNFDVPKFNVKQDTKYLEIENDYFKINYTKEKPYYGTKVVPDANLRVSLKQTDKMWYVGHPEIRNMYGSNYSLDNIDGRLNLDKGLYSPDGFASIDDSHSLIFTQDGKTAKRHPNTVDIYLFIYRQDFEKALKSYFKLTGYPTLIPRYTLGVWWNKAEAYNVDKIQDLNTNFRKNEIPYSILMLSHSWHLNEYGKEKNIKSGFTFNNKLLPNELDFINFMHKNNVHVGLKIDPSEKIYPYEKQYNQIRTVLRSEGEGPVPFNIYNTDAINLFLNTLLKSLKNSGIDLFLVDYNNKKDKNKLFTINHYLYNDYKTDPKKRGVCVSRNPGIASHRNLILYSGETIVSWKTLELLPFFNSTASNIGVSWWTHDIGGYKFGTEDAELYMRYVQLGTYSPIFRFASTGGRYYKREPWVWDVRTLNVVKEYTQRRHQLIPYLYSCAYKYSKEGETLTKPLYYKYPDIYDEPTYKNEYYFGSELFVSPITTPKDTVMNRVIHRIYIPAGVWYELKTGKKFVGGKRYITFYKDEDYPVFAKMGSIIPMARLNKENINSTTPPKKLEIHVFPGVSNSFNLYEDDGVSSMYENGYYLLTNIDYNYRANNYTLIVRPVEGKSGIIPPKRDYKIRFRNTKYVDDVVVYVDNYQIPYKKYIDENDFVIEVEDVSTTSQLTVNCKGKAIEIDAVRVINEDIDSIINDLKIKTDLKAEIANILFSDLDIKQKRIKIKRLRRKGLEDVFIRMFIKLLEYIAQI